MVSADNVNYDVLSLMFAFLGNSDLVSACLVSRSFRIGATPRLYRSIYFRMDNMKRWPNMASPFDTIIAHPTRGVHVRHCEILAVPKFKGEPHPAFIASCAEGLSHCSHLSSFTCMSDASPFITLLPSKERLTELKLHAPLGSEQAKTLFRLSSLHTLSIYQASWNVCHKLSEWIPNLVDTLTSLTLSNSRYLNEVVLGAILPRLPSLQGLHVIGCSQISHHTVLRLTSHTPLLESLSISTWENPSTSSIDVNFCLPHLLYFSVDTRCSFSPQAVPALYSSIFNAVSACPLKSLTIKLSERMIVGDTFIDQVLDDHADTLTRFNAVNISLTDQSLENICLRCEALEQLAVIVPAKELESFSESLSYACNLRTLIDVGDSHHSHGPRTRLSASEVRELFQTSSSLRRVMTGNRCWTCERIPPVMHDEEIHCGGFVGLCECYEPEDCEIKLKLERVKYSSRADFQL